MSFSEIPPWMKDNSSNWPEGFKILGEYEIREGYFYNPGILETPWEK